MDEQTTTTPIVDETLEGRLKKLGASDRYAITFHVRDGRVFWFVADGRGIQRTKALGSGAKGLRLAACFARILNDRERASGS